MGLCRPCLCIFVDVLFCCCSGWDECNAPGGLGLACVRVCVCADEAGAWAAQREFNRQFCPPLVTRHGTFSLLYIHKTPKTQKELHVCA